MSADSQAAGATAEFGTHRTHRHTNTRPSTARLRETGLGRLRAAEWTEAHRGGERVPPFAPACVYCRGQDTSSPWEQPTKAVRSHEEPPICSRSGGRGYVVGWVACL